MSDDAVQPGSQKASTVERAADVLVLFAESAKPTLGVTEIADRLGLSKTAVHRILASLRSRQLIELDEGSRKHSLGLMTMRLGLAYLDRSDIRRVAAPELAALSAKTQETATLSIRTGTTGSTWIRSPRFGRSGCPSRSVCPTRCTSERPSKAFLAFLSEADREGYLARLTVPRQPALREQLEQIRQSGYAVSFGERQPGAGSVAAQVLDHQNRPLAVVSVCGPLERFRSEADGCAAALLKVTTRLSRRSGFMPGN